MNIFVYSDESGSFSRTRNRYYIFGGLILLSKSENNNEIQKYSAIEKNIRKIGYYDNNIELKAYNLDVGYKYRLYKSLNHCHKFCVIIDIQKLHENIFASKQDKQRYLDYAYKIGIKKAFESLISKGVINPKEVESIKFLIDEHTTSTNGRYKLEEALEEELKRGTINFRYNKFFSPLFPTLQKLTLSYCDSKKLHLIRAADIIANRIFHIMLEDQSILHKQKNLSIKLLP